MKKGIMVIISSDLKNKDSKACDLLSRHRGVDDMYTFKGAHLYVIHGNIQWKHKCLKR